MSDPIDHDGLYRLAESQAGYFTAHQALGAGMERSTLRHHAGPGGRYERVRRGPYRLRHFPSSPHEHVVAAWLSLRDAGGWSRMRARSSSTTSPMDGWLRLDERGLLSYTERGLLTDFFDFVNESFADLLPFNTLQRTGVHGGRVHRRMRLLLEAATGMDAIEQGDGWRIMGGWRAFERISIRCEPGSWLRIGLWPGERKPEAERIYGEPDRARRLTALDRSTTGHACWQIRPNVNISNWRPKVRQ